MRSRCIVAVLLVALLGSTASAHYLWVVVDPKSGDHGTVNLYFEGGPGPGDGKYLDPFIVRGTTWIRTLETKKSTPIKLDVVKKPGKRWLAGELPSSGPRAIESFGKFGVYAYGKTNVLLHYYAKQLEVTTAAELKHLGASDKLELDLVPTQDGDTVQVKLLWKGKPAVGRDVSIRGAGNFRVSVKSDKEGAVSFQPKEKGQYILRTSVDEPDRSGTDDGKKFDLARHHVTLIMNIPVSN